METFAKLFGSLLEFVDLPRTCRPDLASFCLETPEFGEGGDSQRL